MLRLASSLLLLLCLAGAAGAQERAFDARDPNRWRALASRACGLDRDGRTALVLEGRRLIGSPDARAACQRAVDQQASRRPADRSPGPEEELLRDLLGEEPASEVAGRGAGASVANVESARLVRVALDRLAAGLADLGLPDPATHERVRAGRTLGWLAGQDGETVWLVTDAPAVRLVAATTGVVRLEPLDEALEGAVRLRRQAQPARRWRGRDFDRSDVERVRLAWTADRLGRPELAGLLLGLDEEPGRDAQASLDVVAMTTLRGEVAAAWERGAPPWHVRERLAPLLRQASGRTLRMARAFADGLQLLEAEARDWSPPSAAEWEALGLEGRLEALAAAARAGALEQPFPADAQPSGDRSGRSFDAGRWSERVARDGVPTARDRLADLGWAALPTLVELLDDPRPIRGVRPPSCCDEDDRPYATVGDVSARLLGRYVGFGTCARQRQGVDAWWSQWSQGGPAAWWGARLRAAPPRSYPSLEARAESDLGWRPRGVLASRVHAAIGDADRAAWLAVAADLREPSLADAFARAAEVDALPLAVIGVRGLAALEDPRTAVAAERLARTPDLARQPAAVEALAALRAAGYPSTLELTRALAAAPPKGRALALSTVLRPDDLDDRLALLLIGSAPSASPAWTDYESRRRPDGSIQRATSLRLGIAADLLRAQRLTLSTPVPELVTATLEAASVPRSVAVEPDLGPVAVAMLTSDVAGWRDDPTRRDQALAVAVRLGSGVVAALGSETGVDLRAAFAEALADGGRAGALAEIADEAGPWVRTWLAEAADDAAAALDRTPRGPRLPCASVELDPGAPAALREAAAGWAERGGVDLPTLVLALRSWAAAREGEPDDAPPGLLLRVRREADGTSSLRLSPVTGPGEPGLVFEVRSGMLERTWWRRPPGGPAEAAQAGFAQLLAPFAADPSAPVELLVRAWR